MINVSEINEHMEVVGSDGDRVVVSGTESLKDGQEVKTL